MNDPLVEEKNSGLPTLEDLKSSRRRILSLEASLANAREYERELLEVLGELSPEEARLVQLDRQYPEIKAYYDEMEKALENLNAKFAFSTEPYYFQDKTDGTVFCVGRAEGRYVKYNRWELTRTRRADEDRAPHPLALKEAEAAGFDVVSKTKKEKTK